MNKTYPINISGIIFYIDEDAFAILDNYLNSLKAHYLKTEDGAEIIQDIESRIAELFSEKVDQSKQVISRLEVDEVIGKLGRVEDIDEDSDEPEHQNSNHSTNGNFKRKYYRDSDDGMIAGVATGLAHYFGVDVIFIRILFLLLIIGGTLGLWIYAILWIISPAAKTTTEKLEMKGEPINISNLEKKVKEEYENVKNSITNKKPGQKVKYIITKIFSLIAQILKGIFSILKGIFGFTFLVIGVVFLSVIASYFIFDSTLLSLSNNGWFGIPIQEILIHFADEKQSQILLISFFFIIIIPIISLTYQGVKLLFNFKSNNKAFGIIALVLFLFSAIIFGLSLSDIAKKFRSEKSVTNNIGLAHQSSLNVRIIDNSLNIDSDKICFEDHSEEFIITAKQILVKAELEVKESKDSLIHIEFYKTSRGSNKQEAMKQLDRIDYNYEFKNDTLVLDHYLIIEDEFRGQEVEVHISLPENCKIEITNEVLTDDPNSDWSTIKQLR